MTSFFVTKKFPIPVEFFKIAGRGVDPRRVDEFWETTGHIADKRGCYIFSMKVGRGELPFYVGKAAKQSFRKECFSFHKLASHYNRILGNNKGAPYLCFVVQKKSKGKWSQTAIDEIEELLIARAAARNPRLSNKHRLPDQSWNIRGVFKGGRGRIADEAQDFRLLLGIKE